MKKSILYVLGALILTFFVTINISFADEKVIINTSLIQEAQACEIVPESTADFCWIVEYIYPWYYTCTEGGIWSCYV